MTTQLPRWRVWSPDEGVQKRKPTAENSPKARPKPFILHLDLGDHKWKFTETISIIDFSNLATRTMCPLGGN